MWHTWSTRSGRADAVVLAEHRAALLATRMGLLGWLLLLLLLLPGR